MTCRRRDHLWLGLVMFFASLTAMVDAMPGPLRVLGGGIAVLLPVVWLWSVTDFAATGIVYYLRDAKGRILYVGETGDRRDADASLEQRLVEHLDDGTVRAWKHDICWANCTEARRCYTTAGRKFSERRRIVALTFANRLRMCPPLHNDTYVARRRVALLSLAWYAVESRVVPGATWHRSAWWYPAVMPPPMPHPTINDVEAAELLEDDVFAETARRVRQRAQRPAEPVVSELDDETVDAEFRRLTDGWLSDEDGGVPDVPGVDDVPGGGADPLKGAVVPPAGTWDNVPGASGETSADPDETPPAVQTPENAATDGSGGGSGIDVAQAEGGASDGAPDRVRLCCEEGCSEVASRGPRCGTHHRAWEADRKRRRRQKGDDK